MKIEFSAMVVSTIQMRGLEADRVRDEALAQLGLTVLRFDNRQVMGQIDDVVEVIIYFIKLESVLV